MYIIKLTCLCFALGYIIFRKETSRFIFQCFCLGNLHVNLTSVEPILTVVEAKQSRNVC